MCGAGGVRTCWDSAHPAARQAAHSRDTEQTQPHRHSYDPEALGQVSQWGALSEGLNSPGNITKSPLALKVLLRTWGKDAKEQLSAWGRCSAPGKEAEDSCHYGGGCPSETPSR